MLFLSLNLIILRGWEQLCTAQPAGDPTGSRFKVIAHPFLTFPRVNYTEHGHGRNPEGSAPVFPGASFRFPGGAGNPRGHLCPVLSLSSFFPALFQQSQPGSGRDPRAHAQPAMKQPLKAGVNRNLGCKALPSSGETPAPSPELGLLPLVTKPHSRGEKPMWPLPAILGALLAQKKIAGKLETAGAPETGKKKTTQAHRPPALLGRESCRGFVYTNISEAEPAFQAFLPKPRVTCS